MFDSSVVSGHTSQVGRDLTEHEDSFFTSELSDPGGPALLFVKRQDIGGIIKRRVDKSFAEAYIYDRFLRVSEQATPSLPCWR